MIWARDEIETTAPVPHGGLAPAGVLDFSANLNPFGPSPAAIRAGQAARWDLYPDPDATELRHLVAAHHDVHPACVLIGNGSSELIDLLCRAYVRRGDRVAVHGPTYGEYARAAQLCGGIVEQNDTAPGATREPALGGEALQESSSAARLLFVANPDNPTGRILPPSTISRLGGPETLLVVDEAYAECVPGFASVIAADVPNRVVLRSLTKAHGLAGLRVGYAVGPGPVIGAMRRARVPWSVNAVALAAAAAAIRDEAHTARTVADWLALRDDLVTQLASLGLKPRVGATPFFMLADPPGTPWGVRLRRHGIAVRDCTSLGFSGYIRISPRVAPDNARLVEAMRAEVL